MKKIILPLVFLTLLIISCRNKNRNIFDENLSYWDNFNQLNYNSKDYQLFSLDSSWYKVHHKTLLDSNFVNHNIQAIDTFLSSELTMYKQFYKYKFYLLDTLKIAKEGTYLLLLEQYRTDPTLDEYDALVMIIISGKKVLTSYHLAHYISSNCYNSIKSSVILDNNRIISRITDLSCSDSQDENGKSPCTRTFTTAEFKYENYYGKFRQTSKTVERQDEK